MPIELSCEGCKQPFYCYPSEAEAGRKFCSLACRGNHRPNRKPAAGQTPVEFTCKECSKTFTMRQAYLTAYRKKYERDPLYCSLQCSDTGRRRDADERNKFTCQHCGIITVRNRTNGTRIYREQKFCSTACKAAAQETSALARFNAGQNGRHIKRHGYVWISVPALANGGKKGSIMEHRYVMQQKLGRPLLREETVHHINGDRQDNRLENLELFSSRHGPGQRVIDKVAFAIEILRQYPEFARQAGVELRSV